MGRIFRIQRFSIHDGPGIRTSVFFKGCPLHCAWCHNPESQSEYDDLAFFDSRCSACGICAGVCSTDATEIRDGSVRIDRTRCVHCFACVDVCPSGARERIGYDITAEALAEILLRDRGYYERSSGGVTLTGGEPLLQPSFAADLFTLMRREGISTAIETCGVGVPGALGALVGLTDLFMIDFKHTDDARHRALTGAPLRPVLDSLRFLSDAGANVLVRIPVVEGESGDGDSIRRAADFLLDETALRRVELLPMHRLAGHKYRALGLSYPADNIPLPEPERIRQFAGYLRERGLEAGVSGQD